MARLTPLPSLRLGSVLVSRGGVHYSVQGALVLIGERGGESMAVLVERRRELKVESFYVTLGMLANMARGAVHMRGPGPRIDWASVPRRALSEFSSVAPHSSLRMSSRFA